ncbi:MAG: hypothetical protein ACUVQ3_08500 [bacterium]
MENDLEKLKAIESERNDLLGKLKKIEEKKATVSHEVYLKVKHDYEVKLKKLDEAIAENKSLIKMELERLKKEIGELTQKQREHKLKLEEIELRYTIGEYSEDKYKELENEAKENFATVAERVKQVEERINWCEGILGGEEVREGLEIEKKEEISEPNEEEKEKKVEQAEELTIDEHILEEKVPDEVKKLDELLMETSALLESEPTAGEKAEEEKKKEKGIACPKCGYINQPDSWYCEKCGAEILTGN